MKKAPSKITNPDPRSSCPVANTLDLVGDKWTLLIIRDLLLTKSRYGDFANSAEGIPTNVLATRLKRLEKLGIVEKRLYNNRPPRYEYLLTENGEKLKGLVLSIKDWGERNIDSHT